MIDNRKLEERVVEITGDEQRKEKRMKSNEDSWRNLWDNIKCTNISITISEGEEEEKEADNIFEDIIAENFTNMRKEIELQSSPGNSASPRQDKLRQEHNETHTNQTDKN